MKTEYDLVIRGGHVVDGSGGESYDADVAIRDGIIVEIGDSTGPGSQELDATGLLVTPGFVDIHTHYDGQVTWDNRLTPSSYHGVTTAVIGNCGVGFAPCKPEHRDPLVRLMDGVEDIPYPVLSEGLSWKWQSFGEFLDLLASQAYDMDFLAYVPHAALRVHVMGERGIDREVATESDLATMCALLAEALDAGAAGIATSRSLFHRSSDGRPIPTLEAADRELIALARTLRDKGKGVFQIVEDLHLPDASLGRIRRLAHESGRPLTFSIGTGNAGDRVWPRLLDELGAANADGMTIKGQVMPRAIGMMLGFELTLNPFYTTPTYLRLENMPLERRLQELRRDSVRAAILAEPADNDPALVLGRAVRDFEYMFVLGDPPDYEQPPERSIASRAREAGIRPEELAYDLMLEGESGGKLYLAIANLRDGRLDDVEVILRHPDVVLGLGDGGAHVGTICDASYSTFALTHWARDRAERRFDIPEIVHKMTGATARIMGLEDRGLIAVGRKADVNVIDFDRLELEPPEVSYDLPGGGRRLVQRARGYVATVNSGRIVYRNGEPTGELPGRLVRVG